MQFAIPMFRSKKDIKNGLEDKVLAFCKIDESACSEVVYGAWSEINMCDNIYRDSGIQRSIESTVSKTFRHISDSIVLVIEKNDMGYDIQFMVGNTLLKACVADKDSVAFIYPVFMCRRCKDNNDLSDYLKNASPCLLIRHYKFIEVISSGRQRKRIGSDIVYSTFEFGKVDKNQFMRGLI